MVAFGIDRSVAAVAPVLRSVVVRFQLAGNDGSVFPRPSTVSVDVVDVNEQVLCVGSANRLRAAAGVRVRALLIQSEPASATMITPPPNSNSE